MGMDGSAECVWWIVNRSISCCLTFLNGARLSWWGIPARVGGGDFGGDLCDFVHNYLRSLSANITSSAALLVVFMIGVKRFFSQKCSD